jgi:Cu/Zn superoxide dismutase
MSTLFGVGALALVATALPSPMSSAVVATAQTAGPSASAVLRTSNGDAVGQVTFTRQDGTTVIEVTVGGLPPRFDRFEIYEATTCDGSARDAAPSASASANAGTSVDCGVLSAGTQNGG